ncbi:tetratricopeptide repeat protein [Niveispirillum fermenti]|uniref:tetratricopeptide repeat protein n=1 Tax=Niveispirillum fermenti TaxID=1233113 RepID=UPI003A86A01E
MSDDFRLQVEAGIAAHAAGRPGEAAGHFAAAVRLMPDHPVALFNLGIALEDSGQGAAALPVLSAAHRLRPDHPHILFRLGSLLAAQGRPEPALVLLARLLRQQPDFPDAAFRLGNALMALDRPAEAERAYRLAVALKPDMASVANNLGGAIGRQNRPEAAAIWYRRAIRLAPTVPEYHKNLGACLISQGRLQEGWPHYDWRDRQAVWGWKRHFPGLPRWDGSPLAGKTILVHFEQGLGDTLQFIRYMSVLKRMGARTLFECQPVMRDILGCVPDIDQLVCHGDPLPPADCFAPLMSLPGLCGTGADTIPGGDRPYLHPPADLVATWAERIGQEGFRVGINWHANGPDRSIPLAAFARIAAIPGIRLFSLQQRAGLDQLAPLAGPLGIICLADAEQDDGFNSFVDSAAIIANLDLVISCDSAMVHVAGAMGRPTFLALPWLADWRWLRHPDRTPWYDCVRMFRAPSPGDWAAVTSRMAQAISGNMHRHGG